jgi:hypothetical protein
MPVPDPFREGLARGWKTYNGSQLTQDLTLEADVAIIGSGAGGGTTAEILSAAGYKVLLIEEGPLKTSSDFKLLEDQAYASLYQEGIGRMSKDGAITILQGRAVGGTTLINWTSSFRTPSRPWNTGPGSTTSRATAGRDGAVVRENGTAPGRRAVEGAAQRQQRRDPQRLRKARLQLARDPAQRARLLEPGLLRHGLPDQRQAIDAGHHHSGHPGKGRRAAVPGPRGKLLISGDKITGLQCVAMDERCVAPTGRSITVKARHYVLAGGGINSPALLLRSDAPDPHSAWANAPFCIW